MFKTGQNIFTLVSCVMQYSEILFYYLFNTSNVQLVVPGGFGFLILDKKLKYRSLKSEAGQRKPRMMK